VNESELRQLQERNASTYLFALHQRCRPRFVNAARLVGANTGQWPYLDKIGVTHPVALDPLLPFWRALVGRYNAELFDPQMELLGNPEPQLERFNQFVYWRLWPVLTAENEVVRNVLRATGSLSSKDAASASSALVTYIANMPFRLESRIDLEDAE
jgi:hypothetical protein